MKKTLMILATATLAFTALPASAHAKVRGCDYRLRSLTEAELALDQAQDRGIGLEAARAQLARARETAFEEGCLVDARPAPRIAPIRWGDDHRYGWHDQRPSPRVRFERLIELGYRRGLSREEFCELQELHKRFGY